MADKNTICNRANGLVKNGEIFDINDGKPRSQACLLYFDECVEIGLSYHDWSFARKNTKPALAAEKHLGFENSYIYPEDCLQIRRYKDENGSDVDVGTCQNIISNSGASKLILTNVSISSMLYTFRQLNPQMWSIQFTEAIEYLIASKVISKATGEKDHNEKYQMYERLIQKAAFLDVKQDSKTYDINLEADYQSPFSGKGF
ncbi:MAG: hypothetical protein PHE89_02665 [Alphaproteobacteria bacterium]|nr:hypothetical protein [Alphaproteobacteria bacterium]